MMLLGVLPALLILGLVVGGTWLWWLAIRGRPRPRPRHLSHYGQDAQAALRRHPAGRDRWLEPDGIGARDEASGPGSTQPAGPDDDPEFISALERLIRGEDPGGPA